MCSGYRVIKVINWVIRVNIGFNIEWLSREVVRVHKDYMLYMLGKGLEFLRIIGYIC